MKRRLLNLLTALSLLLCVATTVLWVRSYRAGPFGEFAGLVTKHAGDKVVLIRSVGAYSSHGRLGAGINHSEFSRAYPAVRYPNYPEGRRLVWSSDPCWERYPFTTIPGTTATPLEITVRDWSRSDPIVTSDSRGAAVPHWLLVGLASVLPVAWVARHWRRFRRLKPGCCRCGYDLRASPGRCPECGTPVLAPKGAGV